MTNGAMPRNNTFGRAGVLWILADASVPATADEIATRAPISDNSTRQLLAKLYREEIVVRRPRESERGERGNAPYEYLIADPSDAGGPDGDWEPDPRFRSRHVMWVLAGSDGALTNREIAATLPAPIELPSIRNTTLNLFRKGMVGRRRRDAGGMRRTPYEYAVADLPGDGDE